MGKSILSSGLNKCVVMVNEMGDREFDKNKFMGKVNLCFRHHMKNSVPDKLMRALVEDTPLPKDQLIAFFGKCLKKSKEYHERNVIFFQ